MLRVRTIVLLVIALLFANAWCVAQCAVAPSQSHLPPCHRQHQTVKPCASPVLVEAPHPPAPSPLAILGPAADPHPEFVMSSQATAILIALSPPSPPAYSPLLA